MGGTEIWPDVLAFDAPLQGSNSGAEFPSIYIKKPNPQQVSSKAAVPAVPLPTNAYSCYFVSTTYFPPML